MAEFKDTFLNLDRGRMQLEENVAKLQKLVQHWQSWESEYEGFKEEITSLGNAPSSADLIRVGAEFKGILLDGKEIKDLLQSNQGQQRKASQVLERLSRRIDYVQDNVKAAEKKYQIEEERLLAINIVIQPDVRNEDGLPLTEIREELDEEGNILSSSILAQGDTAPPVLEALHKASVKDVPALTSEDSWNSWPLSTDTSKKTMATSTAEREMNHNTISSLSALAATEPQTPARPRKKSVTFSEDTKQAKPEVNLALAHSSKTSHKTAKTVAINGKKKATAMWALTNTYNEQIVATAGEPTVPPQIPRDESASDTALRRQMLEYGMNEVNAIVAEMNIEDSDNELSYSEADDEDDDEEDEDQFGRIKTRVVDDDYRREMLALEQRLNAQMIENVGPNPELPKVMADQDDGLVASQQSDQVTEARALTAQKKGVRFAKILNVSEVAPITTTRTPAIPGRPSIAPLSKAVVERHEAVASTLDNTATTKKPSRFKTARAGAIHSAPQSAKPAKPSSAAVMNGPLAGATSTAHLAPAARSSPKPFSRPITLSSEDENNMRRAPEGPKGRTHADVLIERAPMAENAAVTGPDEYDPALMHQEVAVEYHRIRNRMIQRNGGFAKREEPAEVPVDTNGNEVGDGKRVSRFKAARLSDGT